MKAPATALSIGLPILVCLIIFGYFVIADCATTTVFDFASRRLSVRCERPWFGPTRSLGFGELAAIRAVNRSGETVGSWEARLDFHYGTSIRLGQENEGRNEHIRSYVDEIRGALMAGGVAQAVD